MNSADCNSASIRSDSASGLSVIRCTSPSGNSRPARRGSASTLVPPPADGRLRGGEHGLHGSGDLIRVQHRASFHRPVALEHSTSKRACTISSMKKCALGFRSMISLQREQILGRSPNSAACILARRLSWPSGSSASLCSRTCYSNDRILRPVVSQQNEFCGPIGIDSR